MAAHVRPRLPPAAWLLRPGTGALLGASGALSPDVRGRQHAGGLSDHAGELLPRAAPSAASRDPQAADRDDAEVAAAPQAGGVASRGAGEGNDLPPHPLR